MNDHGRTRTTAAFLAALAVIALALGCKEVTKDPRDARADPPDGHLDSGSPPTDAGHGASDAGPPPSDAAVDGSDDPSSVCTPAACEAADGGADGDPPPWGCPEACDPPCEGDTVCCDNGTCQQRALHGCEDGCDVELTLNVSLVCFPTDYSASVCNRGATEGVEPGQVVRFHVGDEVLCETETSEPIAPCTCIGVTCRGTGEVSTQQVTEIRGTLNPDAPSPECGNPLGTTDTGEVWYCE
jgi:hypothetical protein